MNPMLMLLLALQADPLSAEVLKAWRHPWEGFAPGSKVTQRQASKRPDIDAKGELVYKDEIEDVTYSVVTQLGETPTIRIRNGNESSDIPYVTQPPGWFRGKAARKGKETLTVGELKVDCEVLTFTLDEGKDLSQVTTVWKAEGTPVWAVKARVETLAHGKSTTSEEERWVGANAALKIGGKDVLCQVVEVRTEVAGGATTLKREWRTDEIPGRVAKREQRVEQAGKDVPGAALQMDVVSFESKR